MTRDELAAITAGFIDAFNTNDLDATVAFFAPDGIYEEFNGTLSSGHEAVRAAFEPQFTGVFGEMKFIDEDLVLDPVENKAVASWRCTLTVKGEPTSWRGLDFLTYNEEGKVTHKLTYAKTRTPLFE
jgi:uncharacterized protein (TIGR02246 family)